MRTILGLAFDLEGTVVDVEEAHHKAHLLISRELGLGLTLEDCLKGVVIPHFIGGPDEVIYEEMLKRTWGGATPERVAQMLVRKRILFRENLGKLTIQPRPGWEDFFDLALACELAASIGSLTARVEAEVLLSRSGVGRLFPRNLTILREDVEHTKPAPDVFFKTAERMGISPTAQLVFEDSPRGVQAARAAGSVAVGMPVYDRPEVHAALLEAGAFRTFNSWEEINLDELLAAANAQP